MCIDPTRTSRVFTGTYDKVIENRRYHGKKTRLDTKAAALAGGLFWGIGLFMLTWWFICLDGATGEVTLIVKVYRGYHLMYW
jgi:hypothetical protein